jgi:hypothetical protein
MDNIEEYSQEFSVRISDLIDDKRKKLDWRESQIPMMNRIIWMGGKIMNLFWKLSYMTTINIMWEDGEISVECSLSRKASHSDLFIHEA